MFMNRYTINVVLDGRYSAHAISLVLLHPIHPHLCFSAKIQVLEIVAWMQRSEIQVVISREMISYAFTSTSVSSPTFPGFHFIPSGLRLLFPGHDLYCLAIPCAQSILHIIII